MLKCHEIVERGHFEAAAAVDRVVLDLEDRRRRRLALTGEKGLAFLLDMAEVPALRDGDGLKLTDGRIVQVRAAVEDLIEITADDTAHLVRIAWHLGNRHLPTQLLDGRLRIRADHVIEEMVRRLGGTTAAIRAAFDPEGGAYGQGPVHDHHHHHHDKGGHTHAH
ncbi:MAG: urease accessory protein UreE [Minwuia sp.]|uniref:urease accessory protein UreE n=1 Tax=Minwuia sp. TaxID=2493630 RepID=UPI003A859B35